MEPFTLANVVPAGSISTDTYTAGITPIDSTLIRVVLLLTPFVGRINDRCYVTLLWETTCKMLTHFR